MRNSFRVIFLLGTVVAVALAPLFEPSARGAVTAEQVEQAIRDGVRFLKSKQRPDGSWFEIQADAPTGVTSLVTLALLTAGESPRSKEIQRALDFLRAKTPGELRNTYAISLQTIVFATAEPERDQARITANVEWLEGAQILANDPVPWPGSWSYDDTKRGRPGDGSNSQYALLALNAAAEVGVAVKPEVWARAREYWERSQKGDGSWAYHPDSGASTASMTCAGIASLIISGLARYQDQEYLRGDLIVDCGKGGVNRRIRLGLDWMANHFAVGQNPGIGQQWRFYYLYGLERAGRMAGVRFLGRNDWYRLGAERLVHEQNRLEGAWRGVLTEEDPILATSFALLFLAKGRAPVLVHKLFHGPGSDWQNDPDDVRNLVSIVSRDWKTLLTWQVVDPEHATVSELLQAPIAYMSGHKPPELSLEAKRRLRDYLEQGGFLVADACCGSPEFNRGFRDLVHDLFPEEQYKLHPLSEDHPIWRAHYRLSPDLHPLWGVEHGCRTLIVYSELDLSCYWNQAERSPTSPAVIKSMKIGQNIVDYATGRETPADKLTIRKAREMQTSAPRRGAMRIGKLKYAGDWNIAPLAVPNLMDALRKPPFSFDVTVEQKDLFPRDPDMIYYPLIYLHGRAAMAFDQDDLAALRRHIDPGAGTLFADAACGSPAFDASFRRFISQLLPKHALVPIPRDDPLFTRKVGADLSEVEYTRAAGGGKGPPRLEGIKINDHWVVIYSRFDIGCALERQTGLECSGYTHESAVRIAANVVIYSTLP